MAIIGQNEPLIGGEVFDPTRMLARIGGDRSLFAELVQMFVEDYPPLVDRIRRAMAANDAGEWKFAAHTLCGSIGNFTTGRLHVLAKRLEAMAQTDDLADARETFDLLDEGVQQLANSLKRAVADSNG